MYQVDQYIENLPAEQQTIATRLRQLILTLVPNAAEKFSFKIPFYHYFGMFCYINAIPGGVAICFCRGIDLVTEFSSLDTKGRAIIASIDLYASKDIVEKQVPEIIIAAAIWNKEAKQNNVPMVNRKTKKSKNG